MRAYGNTDQTVYAAISDYDDKIRVMGLDFNAKTSWMVKIGNFD